MLSHAIDRPRRTDRQLLGLGVLLASYHVLRTRQGCALVVTQNPGGPPYPDPHSVIPTSYNVCHPERVERVEGISNPKPLLSKMAGAGLGVDYTKEFLSFGRQPSLFKGRNQSWFHPLRTPSRPSWPRPLDPDGGQRAVGGAFAYHLPAALHRPPAARFWGSVDVVSRFGDKAGFCFRWWLGFRVGDPSNRCLRQLRRDDS